MKERSPGAKLLLVGLVAAALTIPLLMVYALVGDRESQSRTAQQAITAGWGGQQIISGPVIVIPYEYERVQSDIVDGKKTSRLVKLRDELFLSASSHALDTALEPERRSKSIYESVIYRAALNGTARFELPTEFNLSDVGREDLLLDEAEIRFGVSDTRGMQSDAVLTVNGTEQALKPGKGLGSSRNAGFFAPLDWSEGEALDLTYSYSLRGSRDIVLVPRGGETEWTVTSPWPHPDFGGGFLPESREVSDKGFTAHYSIGNLALGQAMVMAEDSEAPADAAMGSYDMMRDYPMPVVSGQSMTASIGLLDPVDLYSRVNRSVKYGFLFIGFTFLAYLMFDLVGGARVALAEYLMTGAGLVLFFVLLLAFAEVIGFSLAYLVASGAIIGLLASYSAAVLKSRKRAGFLGALLIGLYALIFVLLSLEAYSLLIGSVLLFVALAGVMYGTRNVEWSHFSPEEKTVDA